MATSSFASPLLSLFLSTLALSLVIWPLVWTTDQERALNTAEASIPDDVVYQVEVLDNLTQVLQQEFITFQDEIAGLLMEDAFDGLTKGALDPDTQNYSAPCACVTSDVPIELDVLFTESNSAPFATWQPGGGVGFPVVKQPANVTGLATLEIDDIGNYRIGVYFYGLVRNMAATDVTDLYLYFHAPNGTQLDRIILRRLESRTFFDSSSRYQFISLYLPYDITIADTLVTFEIVAESLPSFQDSSFFFAIKDG